MSNRIQEEINVSHNFFISNLFRRVLPLGTSDAPTSTSTLILLSMDNFINYFLAVKESGVLHTELLEVSYY